MTFIGSNSSRDGSIASTTIIASSTAIGVNARVACSSCLILGGMGPDAVKVGIGTSSPMSKLSIVQSANNITGGISLSSLASSTRSIFMDDSNILHFSGNGNDATLNAAGAWTNASDRSYKENIVDLSTKYGLDTVLATEPRFYDMKGSHIPQVGFIAQELQPIIPEVVEGQDGNMGISYGNLVAVAFQAIKDLSAKIVNLVADSVTAVTGVFTNLTATTARVQTLCVGQTCLTEAQVKEILQKENVTAAVVSIPVITATTTATTTDTQATSTPQNISTSTPDNSVSSSTPEIASSTPPIIETPPEATSSTPPVIETPPQEAPATTDATTTSNL